MIDIPSGVSRLFREIALGRRPAMLFIVISCAQAGSEMPAATRLSDPVGTDPAMTVRTQ
jgi:hypothetical protein